ncbi:MAG: marine proteobacterial sortase target protein [Pseudomonadota bacterium]
MASTPPSSSPQPEPSASIRAEPSRSLAPPLASVQDERDWYRLIALTIGLALLLLAAGIANAQGPGEPVPERPASTAVRSAVPAGSSSAGGAPTAPAPNTSARAAQVATRLLDTSGAGRLLLHDKSGNTALAPWVDSDVQVSISGVIAHVTLRQGFINVAEDWVAGEYTFPLPADGAIREMRLVLANREIVGQIEEREEARRTYEAAKAAGQQVGLLEQQHADIFGLNVANIPPGERIDVVLKYVQPLHLEAGAFEFRFPMTITPRYAPAKVSAVDRRPTPASVLRTAILDDAEDYRALASLEVTLDLGIAADSMISPSHGFELRSDAYGHQLTLRDGKVAMNRDFVLRFSPSAQDQPRFGVYSEARDGYHYALAMIVPPNTLPVQRRPREMIVVVDTSGSMQGESMRQARRAAQLALDALTPTDRLNVIAFSDEPTALFPFAVPADRHQIRKAREFLRGLDANGGTEMHKALTRALDVRPPADHLRQVVFVTDGAVSSDGSLESLVRRLRGEARLYPVGIGSAPATHLMQRLAEVGRGTYTQIVTLTEVAERMSALFARLEHPVLTDITIAWPAGAEVWPQEVPDLYAGEPLLVSARLPSAAGTVELAGRYGGSGATWQAQIPLAGAIGADGVGVLWAQRKVATLLADGTRSGFGGDDVRAMVVETGLRHGLLTPHTSFVAVERERDRPLFASLEDAVVPALAPAGGRRVGYLATATPAPWLSSMALFLMLFGGLLLTLSRASAERRCPV